MATTKTAKAKKQAMVESPQNNPIPESRLIEGVAPTGTKMSDIIKKGWKKDSKRMTADQIRKEAWQRNNGR